MKIELILSMLRELGVNTDTNLAYNIFNDINEYVHACHFTVDFAIKLNIPNAVFIKFTNSKHIIDYSITRLIEDTDYYNVDLIVFVNLNGIMILRHSSPLANTPIN